MGILNITGPFSAGVQMPNGATLRTPTPDEASQIANASKGRYNIPDQPPLIIEQPKDDQLTWGM